MNDSSLGIVRAVDPDILAQEIAEQIRLLREDPTVREDAAEVGVDLEVLDALPADAVLFEIEKPKNHLSGVAEAIVIKVAVNVGTAAVIALATVVWKRVIKPAISKGSRSVEDKTDTEVE